MPIAARLFCKTGQLAGAGREFREEATIGKLPGNSIPLDAAPISGKHARIFFDPTAGCYMLEDLGSRNGTRVDGVRVREKERLGKLHVITFAEKFDFIFQVLGEKPAGVSRETAKQPQGAGTVFDDAPIVAPRGREPKVPVPPKASDEAGNSPGGEIPVAAPAKLKQPEGGATVFDDAPIIVPNVGPEKESKPAAQPGPPPEPSAPIVFELEVSVGPTAAFTLIEGGNTVGRAESCHVHIEDNSLSRQHALITVKSGRVTLKDLGSKNSTFVGSERIREEVEIAPGAELRFGLVQARLKRKAS